MSSKHDSKSDRVWRKIVSFMLFGMISLLCASVTLKVAVFDTSKLENVFTDYEYVSALRDDVATYTSDIYAKNGLSSENVESIIDYSQLEEAVTAYIAYETNSRIGYTEDSYITPIQTICSDLKADIKTQAENAGLNYTESVGENLTSDIEQYITDAVSLGNIDSIKSIINIGNVAVSIIIGVSAVFSAVLIAILYFIGAHRYRSVRQISISVLSAGGLHLFTALIAYIVISVKKVDLYPIYLRDAFMNFVYNFIGTLASVGAILLIISLMISCFAWLKKKKEN